MTVYRRRAETKKFIINCKIRFFTQEWVLSCSRLLTKIEKGERSDYKCIERIWIIFIPKSMTLQNNFLSSSAL